MNLEYSWILTYLDWPRQMAPGAIVASTESEEVKTNDSVPMPWHVTKMKILKRMRLKLRNTLASKNRKSTHACEVEYAKYFSMYAFTWGEECRTKWNEPSKQKMNLLMYDAAHKSEHVQRIRGGICRTKKWVILLMPIRRKMRNIKKENITRVLRFCKCGTRKNQRTHMRWKMRTPGKERNIMIWGGRSGAQEMNVLYSCIN